MWALFLKCMLGAGVVLIISVLSKSKAFYIAGLVPLFPTFALIAHVIVYQQKGAEALQKTALFGLWSLIPYAIYLVAVYVLATRLSMWSCLVFGNTVLGSCRGRFNLWLATISALKD